MKFADVSGDVAHQLRTNTQQAAVPPEARHLRLAKWKHRQRQTIEKTETLSDELAIWTLPIVYRKLLRQNHPRHVTAADVNYEAVHRACRNYLRAAGIVAYDIATPLEREPRNRVGDLRDRGTARFQ